MNKTLEQRMLELQKALRALQLANNHFFESKDDAYLLLTQAQLRALLVSGGSGMTPLLPQLSATLGLPIQFYALPAPPAVPAPKLAASVVTGTTWSPTLVDRMVSTDLATFLAAPFYFVPSTHDLRSRAQVLKHISNKEGGAHYDEQIVAIVDTLSRATAGYKNADGTEYVLSGVQMFLLDLSALTYWAGMRMGFAWNCQQKGVDEALDPRIAQLDAQFGAVSASAGYFIVDMLTSG